MVAFSVAAMGTDHLEIEAVAAVLDELADERLLIAVARAVRPAPAAVEEALGIAGTADEDVPAAAADSPSIGGRGCCGWRFCRCWRSPTTSAASATGPTGSVLSRAA